MVMHSDLVALHCHCLTKNNDTMLMSLKNFNLQVVMAPHENAESFVDNFMKLLPESDITEFQKVLDMKVCFNNNSFSV